MGATQKQNMVMLFFVATLAMLVVFVQTETGVLKSKIAEPVRIENRLDVSYGKSEYQMMDIYLPSTPEPHPTIVFAHKYNSTETSKKMIPSVVREMTKLGWAVVSVSYGPENENPVSESSIYNFVEATRWLKDNASLYNLSGIFVAAGEGVGGQTAFLAANTSLYKKDLGDLYSGVIMVSSPLDLVSMYSNKNDAVELASFMLPCASFICSTDELKKVSPFYQIGFESPPTYIISGEQDAIVDVSQVKAFEQKYITVVRSGADGIWIDIVAGGDHDLTNANLNTAQLRLFLATTAS